VKQAELAPGAFPDAVREHVNEVYEACKQEHLNAVAGAWYAAQPEPTTADISAMYDDILHCVSQGGAREEQSVGMLALVHYPNAPERIPSISGADYAAYGECALREQSETGWLAPMPTVLE
jgi:hypothetical protein